MVGFSSPDAWDDGKKWDLVHDQPFRVEREVGSDGKLGLLLLRKWACHKDHTGENWVVVYYQDEADLLVPSPHGD